MSSPTTANAGLYIHIPFCVKKCTYCDFCSTTDLSLRDAFVETLACEMALLKDSPLTFDTIYLGGGTPSVMKPESIDDLISSTHDNFHITSDAELTIEVNPGTVDFNHLQAYQKIGINRINIGVQSFSNAALKFLGRIHTKDEAATAIRAARAAGFSNIGLDLIYGLPGQSANSWQKGLLQAIEFSPEHLSCYTLTYEDGTPLGQMAANGLVEPLDEGTVADLFNIMQSILDRHGYEQYEIANFAKIADTNRTSYRSRHNQKYWTSAPYIGLGPSAHSFVDSERRWNVADIHTYISRLENGLPPIEESEILTLEQRLTETLYLTLRTMEGIDIPWLEKTFGFDFRARYGNTLEDLILQGLIELSDTHCALTKKGMRFLDGVVGMLVG